MPLASRTTFRWPTLSRGLLPLPLPAVTPEFDRRGGESRRSEGHEGSEDDPSRHARSSGAAPTGPTHAGDAAAVTGVSPHCGHHGEPRLGKARVGPNVSGRPQEHETSPEHKLLTVDFQRKKSMANPKWPVLVWVSPLPDLERRVPEEVVDGEELGEGAGLGVLGLGGEDDVSEPLVGARTRAPGRERGGRGERRRRGRVLRGRRRRWRPCRGRG